MLVIQAKDTNSDLTIKGISFTNGYGIYEPSGLIAETDGDIYLEGNRFINNRGKKDTRGSFFNPSVAYYGTAAHLSGQGSRYLYNNFFDHNTYALFIKEREDFYGGEAVQEIELSNNLITNSLETLSPAVRISAHSLLIQNNTISHNAALGLYATYGNKSTLNNQCLFSHNTLLQNNDGAMELQLLGGRSKPACLIENNAFSDNRYSWISALEIHNSSNSGKTVFVKHNEFKGNILSGNPSRDAAALGGKNMVVQSNLFYKNASVDASTWRHEQYTRTSALICSDCLVINNLFDQNSNKNFGGAMTVFPTDTDNTNYVLNNTFVNNHSDQSGGALLIYYYADREAPVMVANNIFYNNSANVSANDIFVVNDPKGDFEYPEIEYIANIFDQTAEGFDTTSHQAVIFDDSNYQSGEIDFVDFIARDYRLQSTSPLVNGGNNDVLDIGYIARLELDFGIIEAGYNGEPRIRDGFVDLGAYELQQGAQAPAGDQPCVATYQQGKLTIPCVTVPDPFGETLNYHAQLQLMAFTEQLTFELSQAVTSSITTQHECTSSYQAGLVIIPCVLVIAQNGGELEYYAEMRIKPGKDPLAFSVTSARQK